MNAGSATLRAMTDHGYAVDLFIGELARVGKTEATRDKYREVLYEFAAWCETQHVAPHELTLEHGRRFLDGYLRTRPPRQGQRRPRPPVSASTLALYVSILHRYGEFLEDERVLEQNFAAKLKRPRRQRPDDLPVTTTSGDDVARMIAACDPEHWDELLGVCTLAYLGPRRNAAARLRRRDLDLDKGLVRFHEKGGKEIVKPVPHALLELYREAEAAGVWLSANDYVIPNRRPPKRHGERSNKVVYAIVKRVADRARVASHPHALRAAFAVQFDEQHPDQPHALKELLGHSRIETTMVYLRRKDKARAMEQVRDLAFVLRPNADVPPAGFEPALQPSPVPDPIRRKLEELKARSRGRVEA